MAMGGTNSRHMQQHNTGCRLAGLETRTGCRNLLQTDQRGEQQGTNAPNHGAGSGTWSTYQAEPVLVDMQGLTSIKVPRYGISTVRPGASWTAS